MAKDDKKPQGSFLGSSDLKFNTAGENAPMPGEKVADAPEPLPFGGPRVWIGVAIIVVVMVILFVFYEMRLGTSDTGHSSKPLAAPALSPDDKLDPDR